MISLKKVFAIAGEYLPLVKPAMENAGFFIYENIMSKKNGLYANINAKKKRIAAGSGEKMRKPGSKGAPTDKAFKKADKTSKKK